MNVPVKDLGGLDQDRWSGQVDLGLSCDLGNRSDVLATGGRMAERMGVPLAYVTDRASTLVEHLLNAAFDPVGRRRETSRAVSSTRPRAESARDHYRVLNGVSEKWASGLD